MEMEGRSENDGGGLREGGGLMEMDFMKVEIRWGNWEKMADVSTRDTYCSSGPRLPKVELMRLLKRGDLRHPCITAGPRVPFRYTLRQLPSIPERMTAVAFAPAC